MVTLVTGATGRVGSRFVPRLLAENEPVRVLVRDAAKAPAGAEVVVGDLRDPDTLKRAVDGVDAVIHLGVVLTALARGATPEEVSAVNRDAAVALARASREAGVERFVFASTTLVYGPGRGRPVRETDETRPQGGVYPTSKAEAERALLALHGDDGLGLRIVRLSFVYGEGDDHIPWVLGLAEQRMAAHQRIHLLHHADVAQALIAVRRTAGVDGEVFNAGDDAPMTVAELFALHDRPMPEALSERTVDDPWEGIADTTKIRAELGFRPTFPTLYTAVAAGTHL